MEVCRSRSRSLFQRLEDMISISFDNYCIPEKERQNEYAHVNARFLSFLSSTSSRISFAMPLMAFSIMSLRSVLLLPVLELLPKLLPEEPSPTRVSIGTATSIEHADCCEEFVNYELEPWTKRAYSVRSRVEYAEESCC